MASKDDEEKGIVRNAQGKIKKKVGAAPFHLLLAGHVFGAFSNTH